MGRVLLYTERVSGESHWRVCVVNCCDKAGCGMLAMVWCKRTVSGTTASHTEFVAPPPPGLRTAEKKRSDVKDIACKVFAEWGELCTKTV